MTLEEAFQEEIDNQAVNELVKFHASLQPLIDSGVVVPAIVDGEINPALPEETKLTLEQITDKQSQEIADAIDREIVEYLCKQF